MPVPFDRTPFPLCLPQHDRELAGRSSELAAAQKTYRYAYDKANIRGLAMAESLPTADKPTPEWLAGIAEVSLRIVHNNAQLNGVPGPTAARGLAATIHEGGLQAAVKRIQQDIELGTKRGRVSGVADYAALFREWPLAAEAHDYASDATFARMRVAGLNPCWLRRLAPAGGLPEDFGVTDAHYQAALPGQGTLAAALAEGRLFLCEYRELCALTPGSVPVPSGIEIDYTQNPSAWDAAYRAREAAYGQGAPSKALVAPLALFAVPPGQRELAPVAIQLFPNGYKGQRYPVLTPRDGTDWLIAKACVQAADATVHETISHLGRTHLVQEAFCLAMHNCLSRRHPLHHLLAPHFEGTLSINQAAEQSLVSAGSSVDQLLLPTIGGSIQLAAQAVRQLDFNACAFPAELSGRGVADEQVLPYYPYRDDGRLIWQAIERWVGSYIQHYYPSDAEVAADSELQLFVRQVGEYQAQDAAGRLVGGGLRGVGEDGARVRTRSYLTRLTTQIIWNSSAQHAAVNFPQADLMTYAPLYPLALIAPVLATRPASEADYLQSLPFQESARMQLFIGKLLGGLYYTRLGRYPKAPLAGGYFEEPVRKLEQAFQNELTAVEHTIQERNRTRPAYHHLLPSTIPQSINI